jgi:hypothetical protein
VAGEGTFEVIPVATGFLFGFGLMSISIPMFAPRVRVMTRIETVSFGATLAVGSPILSWRVGLHAAVSPACARQIQGSPQTTSVPVYARDRELLYLSSAELLPLLTGILVALVAS